MKCVKLLVGNDSMNLHPKDYMEWHVRNLPRGCNKAFLLNRKARHFDSEYVATSNLVHLKLWIGRIRTEWRNIDHCLKRHYSVRILLKAYNHQVVLKKHYANLKVNRFGNVAGQMHLFVLLPCFFGVAEHLTECSSTLSFIFLTVRYPHICCTSEIPSALKASKASISSLATTYWQI